MHGSKVWQQKLLTFIPSIALQSLLGPGVPWKMPPFFSVFCSSPWSLYSKDLCFVPPDNSLPSCSWFSHWSSLWNYPLRTFFGIVSSSILIIWPTQLSLPILDLCINYKFHNSIKDASVLYLVLGHKTFLIFYFQVYIAFVLSFVLGWTLHFHNTVLA